jgi:hypothetical protein
MRTPATQTPRKGKTNPKEARNKRNSPSKSKTTSKQNFKDSKSSSRKENSKSRKDLSGLSLKAGTTSK